MTWGIKFLVLVILHPSGLLCHHHSMALTRENVTRIRFDTKNYELKQIVLWTDGCGEKPFYFNSKLKPLLRSESWKDRTGVAYMCQLYKNGCSPDS